MLCCRGAALGRQQTRVAGGWAGGGHASRSGRAGWRAGSLRCRGGCHADRGLTAGAAGSAVCRRHPPLASARAGGWGEGGGEGLAERAVDTPLPQLGPAADVSATPVRVSHGVRGGNHLAGRRWHGGGGVPAGAQRPEGKEEELGGGGWRTRREQVLCAAAAGRREASTRGLCFGRFHSRPRQGWGEEGDGRWWRGSGVRSRPTWRGSATLEKGPTTDAPCWVSCRRHPRAWQAGDDGPAAAGVGGVRLPTAPAPTPQIYVIGAPLVGCHGLQRKGAADG